MGRQLAIALPAHTKTCPKGAITLTVQRGTHEPHPARRSLSDCGCRTTLYFIDIRRQPMCTRHSTKHTDHTIRVCFIIYITPVELFHNPRYTQKNCLPLSYYSEHPQIREVYPGKRALGIKERSNRHVPPSTKPMDCPLQIGALWS